MRNAGFGFEGSDDLSLQEELDRLHPCERLVVEDLNRLAKKLEKRFAEGLHALILVAVDDPSWMRATIDAANFIVRSVKDHSGRQARYTVGALDPDMNDAQIELVAQKLHEHSVVICTKVAFEDTPSALRLLADGCFVVPALDASRMETILRRRHTSWKGQWPCGNDPSTLKPSWIDLVVRRSPSAARAIKLLTQSDDFRKKETIRPPQVRSAPAFPQLNGYGKAKPWGLRLADDIAAYMTGDLAWADIDSGALIAGPPGTGKSMFAQSLAEHIGCSFTATSYAQWQASGSGHLGDVIKTMRQIFENAAKEVPSIIFIDEIDTLPARVGSGNNADWWRSITNCLLELIDGIGRSDGIIVVAACNSPEQLDPALVRSGRLDRTFHITLPDEMALFSIIRESVASEVPDEEIESVATALAGTISGADAKRIARDARTLARHERRPMRGNDLHSVALPVDHRPAVVRWRMAVHEAAHAIVAMATGQIPRMLSIVPDGATGGRVTFQPDWGGRTSMDFDRVIKPILAGRAAEDLLLGAPSSGAGGGTGSDLGMATSYLSFLDGSAGLGTKLSMVEEADRNFVELQLRRLDAETRLLVLRHRSEILELAELAMTKRVLGSIVLREFAERNGFTSTAAAHLSSPNGEKELVV